MKRVVVIIAGSVIEDMEFLRQRIEAAAPEAVLCADGGARYAHALGLAPDLIIGDMDSLEDELLRHFEEKGVAVAPYPIRKDETDTQLALIQALAMNPEEILIFGAMGRRLDHTLANLGLLMMGLEKGVPVRLLDEDCEVFVITGAATLNGKKGQTVSIFPWVGEGPWRYPERLRISPGRCDHDPGQAPRDQQPVDGGGGADQGRYWLFTHNPLLGYTIRSIF